MILPFQLPRARRFAIQLMRRGQTPRTALNLHILTTDHKVDVVARGVEADGGYGAIVGKGGLDAKVWGGA